MRIQQSPSPAPPGADRSIGTLWTLTRGESTARCVLLRVHGGLELRVLMDDSPLRAERCGSHRESFALAGRWRDRMMARGWMQMSTKPSA